MAKPASRVFALSELNIEPLSAIADQLLKEAPRRAMPDGPAVISQFLPPGW